MDWSVRLHDGRLVKPRTQAPTKGEVRRRAKAKAAELLTTGTNAAWRTTTLLTDYTAKVSWPAMEDEALAINSKKRYRIVAELLEGKCNSSEHKHTKSLKGLPIAAVGSFRIPEACVKEIARLHGTETGRQARTVLSKYVLDELVRDELIPANPLRGQAISLPTEKASTSGKKGGVALSRKEYVAVVDHLLALDPAEGQVKPARGRWTLAHVVAKRRNAIDITLFQAATGLRVSEANHLRFSDLQARDDGTLQVYVAKEIAKTKKARTVPILNPLVAERLKERMNAAPSPTSFIIGAPADQDKPWDAGNCQDMTTALYLEMHEELGIEAFETERTHVWRATLNSLLLYDVPEAVRAEHFGHDVATNRASYTDLSDTSEMFAAARRLRAV